jgi:hypothetical protein
LKKRSKKLLFHGRSRLSTSSVPVERNEEPGNKSFLLLFFKKEVLSFLPQAPSLPAPLQLAMQAG